MNSRECPKFCKETGVCLVMGAPRFKPNGKDVVRYEPFKPNRVYLEEHCDIAPRVIEEEQAVDYRAPQTTEKIWQTVRKRVMGLWE